MATWKFTDQFGTAYPSIAENSILGALVFDIDGSSPISGTAFTGSLDLPASGNALNILGELTGMSAIPFSGTVSTTNNILTVTLSATNTDALTQAFAKAIPIVGNTCKAATLEIHSVIPATLQAQDFPETDEMNLGITFSVGSASVTIDTQVPMSDGFFALTGVFDNVGITLSDLNFIVPGTKNFGPCFPATQLGPYYNNQTQLALLEFSLDVYVTTTPSLSVVVSSVGVSIGITNIPLYEKALYLDPLGVWVQVSAVNTDTPLVTWGLMGSLVLCNYNTPGDTARPDFTFELSMGFPNPPGEPNFSVSGEYQNPYNLPVSQIVSDFMGQATDLGIGDSITLETLDFSADADAKEGTISSFDFEIAMSGSFGIFEHFSIESFSLAFAYSA